MMTMNSKYEQFVADAEKAGYEAYRKSIEGNGTFEYRDVVNSLIEFEDKANVPLFQYLFGEQLGIHYATIFFNGANRSILKLFGKMESAKVFYMLHEMKTNKTLYAYCYK
jgi:hypothetical protein